MFVKTSMRSVDSRENAFAANAPYGAPPSARERRAASLRITDMLAAVLLAFATATFQPVDAATTSQPVQVFVHDNSAQAQSGDGGHNWGLRPPTINDPETAPLYNARGDSLKSLLG